MTILARQSAADAVAVEARADASGGHARPDGTRDLPWQRASQSAQSLVKANFGFERLIREVDEWYSELLEKKN